MYVRASESETIRSICSGKYAKGFHFQVKWKFISPDIVYFQHREKCVFKLMKTLTMIVCSGRKYIGINSNAICCIADEHNMVDTSI